MSTYHIIRVHVSIRNDQLLCSTVEMRARSLGREIWHNNVQRFCTSTDDMNNDFNLEMNSWFVSTLLGGRFGVIGLKYKLMCYNRT